MKKMKVLGVLLTIFMFAFVALGSAEARRGHDRKGMHGEKGMRWGYLHVLDKLDLTQEQKQKVAGILKGHREEIGKVSTGMMEARLNLHNAVMAEEFSEDAVKKAAAAMAEQKAQGAVLFAGILKEVRQVLTPEQKQKLAEMKEKRDGKFKGHGEARLSALDKWIAENSN